MIEPCSSLTFRWIERPNRPKHRICGTDNHQRSTQGSGKPTGERRHGESVILVGGTSYATKFAIAYTMRGAACSSKGDYDPAIADQDKAIELDSKGAVSYGLRGIAYNERGRAKSRCICHRTCSHGVLNCQDELAWWRSDG
jgi:tetratricopeptide (TPR) repeat protein